MENQHFSGFYRKSIQERLALLQGQTVIGPAAAETLRNGGQVLTPQQADRMVENAVGVFGLPLGVGLNFSINGHKRVVPMAVEEPSIVAAVSAAAKLTLARGGFQTSSDDPLGIGQIVVEDVVDPANARKALLAEKQRLLELANSLHPRLLARGGGGREIEIVSPRGADHGGHTLTLHLLVDTRDAMGANLINSMCESLAVRIEGLTGGRVLLRILSNLNDRALARARTVIDPTKLARNGFRGPDVRDRIIAADRIAAHDPYRAATHNKGIMNGIDAVAIATGNDWRAIEAGAHAYAARDGRYRALTRWEKNEDGHLVGQIELPLNVGIVGGSLASNPAVKLALEMLQIETSRELAETMAAVGLAQNLAALRALVTEGIQRGHMRLHARSVAQAAGADPGLADQVVERLVASGTVKVWKAREIIAEISTQKRSAPSAPAGPAQNRERTAADAAHGKVILLGEHAILYGGRALAAPIPLAVQAQIAKGRSGVRLVVPRWGLDTAWEPGRLHRDSILRALDIILHHLGVTKPAIRIEIDPQVPRAMGLGSSAAAAVAVTRALSTFYRLNLSATDINRIAYAAERIMHGRSSGLDNTVISKASAILYRADRPLEADRLTVARRLPFVVGLSRQSGLTAPMVARVRQGWRTDQAHFESLFQAIDRHVGEAHEAIKWGDLGGLGQSMNANQRLLQQLNLSTPELDAMIKTALRNEALGAKLTGGGGGGAMIALCADDTAPIAASLKTQGWESFTFSIDPRHGSDTTSQKAEAMSPSQERLIMVDADDKMTGTCTRAECHAGDGLQHRAFSIFIFDRTGRVLLQQRSREKPLWPLYWSNSCCSHPRVGESTVAAAHRRLTEELGIDVPLTRVYKFAYQARYDHTGSENELCTVFIGQTDQTIEADPHEINAWRHIAPDELDAEIAAAPERFTPWLKLEWARLRQHPLVKALQLNNASAQSK